MARLRRSRKLGREATVGKMALGISRDRQTAVASDLAAPPAVCSPKTVSGLILHRLHHGRLHCRKQALHDMMCGPRSCCVSSKEDDMHKFTSLTGVAAPLPMINVDTEKIIPKQFLKTIKRTGLWQEPV